MTRAPFQVLIIPFRFTDTLEYAVTKRADSGLWQFLSGGGELGESPIEAAKREAFEEGGIPAHFKFKKLDSMASIRGDIFKEYKQWGNSVYSIPEYSFSVDMQKRDILLSDEHTEVVWTTYDDALELLKWDSNKTALWELNERVISG